MNKFLDIPRWIAVFFSGLALVTLIFLGLFGLFILSFCLIVGMFMYVSILHLTGKKDEARAIIDEFMPDVGNGKKNDYFI